MKATREPMSSSRLCTGVPVRHHRKFDENTRDCAEEFRRLVTNCMSYNGLVAISLNITEEQSSIEIADLRLERPGTT